MIKKSGDDGKCDILGRYRYSECCFSIGEPITQQMATVW